MKCIHYGFCEFKLGMATLQPQMEINAGILVRTLLEFYRCAKDQNYIRMFVLLNHVSAIIAYCVSFLIYVVKTR